MAKEKPKLNVTLLEVLELYENAKDTFPLHRFFTTLQTPLVEKLYREYLKFRNVVRLKDFKDDDYAESFLEILYNDFREAGLERFIDYVKIENLALFHSGLFRANVFLLVFVIAMQNALPDDRKKEFSLENLSEDIHLGFNPKVRRRINFYSVLSGLFKSTLKLNVLDLCSYIIVKNRFTSQRTVEQIIEREVKFGKNSLFVLEEFEEKFSNVLIKGKKYNT